MSETHEKYLVSRGALLRRLKSGRVGGVDLGPCQPKEQELLRAAFALNDLLEFLASGCPVMNEQLQRLEDWPKLRRLELDDTAIDDQALPYLAACPNLTSLSIRQTEVTPEGLKWLRQRLLATRIRG